MRDKGSYVRQAFVAHKYSGIYVRQEFVLLPFAHKLPRGS